MTPTVNFSHLKDLEDKAVVQHNLMFSNSSGSMSSLTAGVASTVQGSKPTASTSGQSSTDPVASHNPAASYPKEQSTSTATIETMMTLSPSETRESTYGARPPATGKPDCNLIYAKTNVARQPHQGQNPTVERNTHKNSDEELAVEGNTLVNRCRMTAAAAQQNGNVGSGALLLNAIARNGEARALVDNDLLDFQNQNTLAPNATPGRPPQGGRALSAQRVQHRISFVPNPVDAPGGQVPPEPIVHPKKQNIPSNGAVNYSVARVAAPSCDKTSNKKKKPVKNKSPSFRKFTFPFGFGRRGKANQSSNSAPSKDNRNNGEVRQMASEVCLVDGRTVVRPNSLALNGVCATPNEHHVSNMNLQAAGLLEAPDERRTGVTENLLNLELVNGNPSGCGEGGSSEGEAANKIANTGSSRRDNTTSGGCGNTAAQQPTANKDGAGNSSSPYDGDSAGTDSTNKSSSHSERSVSDNMAYEASCSPVKRVGTCLV